MIDTQYITINLFSHDSDYVAVCIINFRFIIIIMIKQ